MFFRKSFCPLDGDGYNSQHEELTVFVLTFAMS